jgi:alpha-L-fucosidase
MQAPIPIAEFEKIGRERFTAENFDADKITDLALEAGCRYVNITTRHHDGFCLWDSESEPFNAMNMPAKRDLVKELSDACDKKGLGFLPYWSLARDWRHPHAPPSCRPPYEEYFGKPDPHYAPAAEQDIEKYNAFAKQQITELFTKYKLAGIWFDGVGVGRPLKDQLRLPELYAFIRKNWPHALISYKNGVVGSEDFLDAEGILTGAGLYDKIFFDMVDTDMPREVCSNIGKSWAYNEASKGRGLSANAAWNNLGLVSAQHANWLLNTGPMPDGSIEPAHADTYRALGEQIRKHGYPKHEGAFYEECQDTYAKRLVHHVMRKGPMFKGLKIEEAEKDSAAEFFSNHLVSLSLPPSRQDRRDVYFARAVEFAEKHQRNYAGTATGEMVREALAKGKDYEVKAMNGKGLLYSDAETE